jgi:hypothetical protein
VQWLRTMSVIKMKPSIWSKHQRQLSQVNVLLDDNVYSHTGAHSVATLQKLWYVALEHPPHSSDLATSGYHLFGPLKNALKDHHIATSWRRQHICGLTSSQKHFFLWRNTKVLDQMCWKAEGLHWKMMHLKVLYCYSDNFNKYTADTIWLTLIIKLSKKLQRQTYLYNKTSER